MKWVFETSFASFYYCPFPNCITKPFLVHQRAWTCRYIPPTIRNILIFLVCSNMFRPWTNHFPTAKHLNIKVWKLQDEFCFIKALAGPMCFQTSHQYSRPSTGQTSKKNGEDFYGFCFWNPRKLRENLQKLSKDHGDTWGQWLKAEERMFQGDYSNLPEKTLANEFGSILRNVTYLLLVDILHILEP